MLSDILSITDGAFHALAMNDQVLDTNQFKDNESKSSSNDISSEKIPFDISSSSNDTLKKENKRIDIPNGVIKEDVFIVEPKVPSPKDIQNSRLKAVRTLYQGNCISYNSDLQRSKDDDVIAERCSSKDQLKLCREKLKSKTNSKNKHGRVIYPAIVHQKEAQIEKEIKPCCNQNEQLVASSIAPFIQIQSALEDKIASLVSTLKSADVAEKEYLKNHSSKNKSEESTIMLETMNRMEENLKDLKKNAKFCRKDQAQEKVEKSTLSTSSIKPSSPPLVKKQPLIRPPVEQQVFQTPIPRRKPPQPAFNHSSWTGTVSKENSAPRLSRKGYVLLHEILKENQSPHPSGIKQDTKLVQPPLSCVLPTPSIDNTKRVEESRDTQISNHNDALYKGINRIMKETTGLKERIQNVNKDMEQNTVTSTEESDESKEKVLRHYEPMKNEKEDAAILTEYSISEDCPLDKYLVYPKQTEFLKENKIKEAPKKVDSIVDRVADVLRRTEDQRRQLDDNIHDLLRKHNELNTFLDLPTNEREENTRRIKKDVDEKIKLIKQDIQLELKKEIQPTVTKKGLKSKIQTKTPSNRISLVGQNRLKNKNAKVNSTKIEETQTKIKKVKQRKNVKQNEIKEPPPSSSTAYDELIIRHLYGRQPQLPARKTIKQQKLATNHTDGRDQTNLGGIDLTMREKLIAQTRQTQGSRDVFYFHPQQSTIRKSGLPVSGDLFPVAVQLAEPSRDPSKRVPIYCNGSEAAPGKEKKQELYPSKPKPRQLCTSNVAVVEMKHEESDTSQTSSVKEQIKANLRKRVKEKIKLNFQPLPNVDIDTTEASTLSATTPASSVIEITKSPSKYDGQIPEEYSYGFQDYIAVGDIHKTKNSTLEGASGSEEEDDNDTVNDLNAPVTTLQGGFAQQQQSRHDGPPFPPQRPGQCLMEGKEIRHHEIKHFEQIAYEWLEQELLAKIVSQLEVQNADPTLKEMADRAEMLPVQIETDSQSWIDHIIGYHGIQLFMDAGVPVDKDLIIELLRHVIVEKLESLYGYPQPRGKYRDITEANDETENFFDSIHTPIRTPSPVSARDGSPPHFIHTPEQSSPSLAEQSLKEVEITIEDEPVSFPHVTTPLPSEIDNDHHSDIVYPGNNMATPLPSVTEDNDVIEDGEAVVTPDQTEVENEISLVEQIDFVPTSPERSLTPQPPPQLTPPITYVPPTPFQPKSPSTPSTTLQTYSTSTTVGLSTIDGVSDGEILCPSRIISDGSAGEPADVIYPYVIGHKTLEETIDDPFSYDTDEEGIGIKNLVESIIHPSGKTRPLKSEGEVTPGCSTYSMGQVRENKANNSTQLDDVDIQEDTLNSVTLHQYDLKEINHPEIKTRHRLPIQVCPVILAEKPYNNDEDREGISEGEIFIKDKTDNGNVLHDTELSIGQFIPNQNFPMSDLSDSEDVPLSTTNSIGLIPRDNFTAQSPQESNATQSEGELPISRMRIGEINRPSAQMVLTLPTVEDDDELVDIEENLSEYDISTLSGGEL